MDFRYRGFDQHDNTRTYRFDSREMGRPAGQMVVTADLTLFLKHHVRIQEGPALCARKLTADSAALTLHDHQLTNEDLLEFVIARADAAARNAGLRRGLRRRSSNP